MKSFHRHHFLKKVVAGVVAVMFFIISTDMIAFAEPMAKHMREAILGKRAAKVRTMDFDGNGKVDLNDLTYFTTNAKEEEFSPGQAKKMAHKDVEISVGANALKEKAHLSITPLREVSLMPLNPGMINVTRGQKAFRFLPHPMKFGEKISVKLPYDKKSAEEAGSTENDIRTYYFDDEAGVWMPLETVNVDKTTQQVESYTTHFTDMINAVVTVPDSPESVNFNPTQIKDIKAADPSSNIALIQPPTANSNGAAQLSFPIQVALGRVGVQPQLALQYNSEGGNGWLGMGWDLPMQAVVVDTLWGVPHYDTALESENYRLNGEFLTPVAHRTELPPRTAEKLFHARVEGAFNKILRHGTNPQNYWWEVKDKNGTSFFYGGRPETGQVSNALLKDYQGNVFKWALVEIRDTNQNNVTYHYATVQHAGVLAGTVPGYELYLKTIRWTGHQGSEGLYQVEFLRDRELGEPQRVDVMIDARGAFKKVTADLLRKIVVTFNGQPIRSYELKYQSALNNPFYKTLLASITQYGDNGAEFYTHTFDYYDDARIGLSYKAFAPMTTWNSGKDGISEGIMNHGDTSAINVTKTKDKGGSLSLSVGWGPASISGGMSKSKSKSEGLLALADINGDGLPDKVYKKGKSVYYRPNQSGPHGTTQFGPPHLIPGLPEISIENSETETKTLGVSVMGSGASKSTQKTKTKQPIYFMDSNSDGLVDLAYNGLVYFNHRDSNGNIFFTPNSGDTYYPLGAGAAAIADSGEDYAQMRQEFLADYPLLDVVRRWQAPFDGQISITGAATLAQDDSEERQTSQTADGVRVAIQQNDRELWAQNIAADDYAAKTPQNVAAITVKKGDAIYFRVQSIEDGAFDAVRWNPVIQYLNVPPTFDANHSNVYRYEAAQDFTLAGGHRGTFVNMPVDGTVRLFGAFRKAAITTDDVTVQVFKNDAAIYSKTFAWNQTGAIVFDEQGALKSLSVQAQDRIAVRVKSDSPIDMTTLSWQQDNPLALAYVEPTDQLPMNLLCSYDLYPRSELTTPLQAWVAPQTGVYAIKPLLAVTSGATVSDSVIVATVKRAGELVGKHEINIANHVVNNGSFSVEAKQGDALYFEFSTDNPELLNTLQTAVAITAPDGSKFNPPVALYSAEELQVIAQAYRGWTIFGYNGSLYPANTAMHITEADVRGDALIAAAKAFEAESAKLQQAANSENEEALEAALDELNEKYEEMVKSFPINPFVPEPMLQRWRGTDEEASVQGEMMISSRNGLDSLEIAPNAPAVPASGAISITKASRCKGKGTSGNLGPASGSKMKSDCYGEDDMMDMNGDRFPDIVNKAVMIFSDMMGVLQGGVSPSIGDLRHTKAESKSGGVGGGSGSLKIISNSKGRTDSNGFSSPSGNPYSASMQASVSISKSKGTSDVKYDIMDVNGDGLPDRVYEGSFMVALGLGYGFAPAELWGSAAINEGKNSSTEVGVGIGGGMKFPKFGISGGVGVSGGKSKSESVRSLSDINSDGLLDIVLQNSVLFNMGGSYSSPVAWAMPNGISVSKGSTVGANASLNATIPLPSGFNIGFGGGAQASESISHQEVQFVTDINGDGHPDYLASDDESSVQVGLSQIERTNLLKTVHRPLGATISLDYERVGNTFEMPQSKWALSRVEVNDGHQGDGVDVLLNTYQYKDGFYNRQEREFYGFKTVIEEQRNSVDGGLYRSVTRTFHNDSYYNKGLLASEVLTDAQGRKYTETKNTYLLRNIETGAELSNVNHLTATVFPELIRVDKLFYEGEPQPGKFTFETYQYDALGNVIKFFDAGDLGADDDIEAEIGYFSDAANYIVGKANNIVVRSNGRVMRKREANFEQNTGNLTQVRQYLGDGQAAVTDLTYDQYGNIKTVTGPVNYKGQRYQLTYAYDPTVFTHNVSVTDSFGYASTADYDLKYGAVTRTTDLNANSILYAYDPFGRVSAITGPYQTGTGHATIAFEYHHDALPAWALTQHLDVYRNLHDPIETVLFVDGLARTIQTKKDGTIHQSPTAAAKDVQIVSGHQTFDFVGRTIEQYYPVTEPLGQQGKFNPEIDAIRPTVTTYDVLDRTTTITIPDLTATTMAYGFGSDRDGQLQFLTRVTDANGMVKESFRDVNEQITAVKEFNAGQTIWTSYAYDALNQIVRVNDDKNNQTLALYDNLGRRTHLNSPDAGLTETIYDLASNVTQKITANLRNEGKTITYDYTYNRLNKILYPNFPGNNVTYTYGAPGAAFNRANRLVTVTDESGMEERFYGPLGETVKTIKTLASDTQGNSANSPEIYVTEYEFDTWNRLQRMIYPDGERLTNQYDSGGLLRAISGRKAQWKYDYLNRLEYDKFSQRVFMEQANGVRTTYDYNRENRRLTTLQAGGDTKSAPKFSRPLFQDLAYGYDNVGNILSLSNRAGVTQANQMGGTTQFVYQYDDLYRLTHAEAAYQYMPDKERKFTLDMQYDTIHNIVTKHQQDWVIQPGSMPLPQRKTTYNWTYAYAGMQPHAPTHIGDPTAQPVEGRTFTYDANGNQLGWADDTNGTERTIIWDEENRIQNILDNGHEMTYKYNDAGERVIKSGPQGETAYINQFFTIRNREVGTKHIYAGTVRVVSKLMKQEKPGAKTNEPNGNADPTKTNNGKGQAKKADATPTPTADAATHQRPEEFSLYFFHPDHLGSSAYVTDKDGELYQHLEYFPFGETWVEESSNTQRTPYLFTAKELDEETQLSYFGARYYDPRTSVWQSPDPILGKYLPTGDKEKDKNLRGMGGVFNSFSLGLYTYSHLNPIKYYDPDGNESQEAESAVFVQHPLFKYAWKIPFARNPIDNFTNTEISHEHIFFYDKNGKLVDDVGFGPTGRFSYGKTYGTNEAYDPSKIPTDFVPINKNRYDPKRVYQSMENLGKRKWFFGTGFFKGDGVYGGVVNNCQGFTQRVRNEYNKLASPLQSQQLNSNSGGEGNGDSEVTLRAGVWATVDQNGVITKGIMGE